MRRLFIRTNKTQGDATLYTEINLRRARFRAIIPIGVSVDIHKWHSSFDSWERYENTSEGKKIKNMVKDIDSAIDNAISEMDFSEKGHSTLADIPASEAKGIIRDAIESIIFKEAREAKSLQDEEQRRTTERAAEQARIEQARKDADVRAYLESLIRGMKDGSIRIEGKGRNKGERYTPNTIKMWQSLAGIIERYYQVKPFTWDCIDKKFASRFRAWMEDEGYMAKSINKYIGQFVALVNRAYDEGKHTNQAAANSFMKPAVDEAQKAAEIYLTADELNALYQMPLTGEKALVRDIFIVGCCTCQRVSDYSRIKKENFVTTAKGVKVVKIKQQKTQNFVTIPILDDKLTAIMEKYKYNLPTLPSGFDVILNRYIKEICKELAVSVPSLNDELPTILTMKERAKEERGEVTFKRDEAGRVVKPRYELVTSHTARRTGITNLYLTGKFDVYQMMHISGHKEAKTFREYIKLSGDEMAEQIAEKMGNDNLF